MPMIVNEKMRIHYRVEGERGAFLLLHHGLFGSLRDWYETDWVKELSGEFRLILVDSRGHGRSDPVGSPGDFTLEGLARDVVAVLDELNIRNSHYLGYGLGAMVGFELIRNHPERLRITMLGGEVPYVTAESVETWNRWSRTLAQESLAGLVAKLKEERLFSGIAPSEREAGDACEEMILQGLCAHKPWQGERLSMESPVTIFSAQNDPALERIRESRKMINRARFVSMDGLGHHELLAERKALLGEVLRLLRSGRKPGSGEDEEAGSTDKQVGKGHKPHREGKGGGKKGPRNRDARKETQPDNKRPEGQEAVSGPVRSVDFSIPPPVDLPVKETPGTGSSPAGKEPDEGSRD